MAAALTCEIMSETFSLLTHKVNRKAEPSRAEPAQTRSRTSSFLMIVAAMRQKKFGFSFSQKFGDSASV